MELVFVKTIKEKQMFIKFRKKLYKNDPYYVSTIEFTFDMLFNKETAFSKECLIKPVMVIEDKVLSEAILIRYPDDDFVQIAFFEALSNQDLAVKLIKEEAFKLAKELNLKRVIVGLNGHLSYGVGLTLDIKNPNTFDSTYSKPYYIDYFKDADIKHPLYAYSNSVKEVFSKFKYRESDLVIRKINLKNFENEMEIFKDICNKTIGKTFLYQQAKPKHFYELMKDMLFFLKEENILFAEKNNEVIGFVFWHPDYNEILKKGKQTSLIEIAFRYILKKKKIKRVKLNAIGVLEEYEGITTMLLLNEVKKYIGNYEYIETNFVWENNEKSSKICRHLIKEVERSFMVYEYECS